MPLPAIDFGQTLLGPVSSSASVAVHWSSPLVLSFSVLGNVIAILLAVVLLAPSFLTVSVSFSDFGLDFVPALVGETLTVTSTLGAGVWAYAMPAVPRASVATVATRKDLRKEDSSRRFGSGLGAQGVLAPRRGLLTTRQRPKRFRC